MSDDEDRELRARLRALEDGAPAGDPPGIGVRRSHRRRIALSLPAAALLLVALAASATGAAIVVGLQARGTPGVENPGQPLAGAKLECMSPPDAAAFLAARGYTSVVWQIERGDASMKGGPGSTQAPTPPDHGFVVPGSIIDGTLYMVVDQRSGATGVGVCHAQPMP